MQARVLVSISLLAWVISSAQEKGAAVQNVAPQVKQAGQEGKAVVSETKQAAAQAVSQPAQEKAPVAAPAVVQASQGKPVTAQPPAQSTQSSEKKSALTVARSSIVLNIRENEPENASETFPPEVRRLYCFTHIKGASGETEVQHRWYWNDDLIASIPLTVKSVSWRTYSAKTIPSGMIGEWRVAIVDATSDEVLQMMKFRIQ